MNHRNALRPAIPEIFAAANILQSAVRYHNAGEYHQAALLFRKADNPNVKIWVESIIGKKSPYIQYRPIPGSPPTLTKSSRVAERMPTQKEKMEIHKRDGFQCRFCQTPVIRPDVRNKIIKAYPDVVPWGKSNASRHAAFFALWAQYDHILPHARGGDNSLDNMILTCSACNFGRMNYTLEEVGVKFPDAYSGPIIPDWDGLENFQPNSSNSFI